MLKISLLQFDVFVNLYIETPITLNQYNLFTYKGKTTTRRWNAHSSSCSPFQVTSTPKIFYKKSGVIKPSITAAITVNGKITAVKVNNEYTISSFTVYTGELFPKSF